MVNLVNEEHSDYFEARLNYDQKRAIFWRVLCESYLNAKVPDDAVVLEIGCGYGDLINSIKGVKKIAVDIWGGASQYLNVEVDFHRKAAHDLEFLNNSSIDVVCLSNIIEHLDRNDLNKMLDLLKTKLKPNGSMLIIQPNYKHCYRQYFDDYTHVSIHTDISLSDLLKSKGYRIMQIIPKFLPLTLKSRFPIRPFLIKIYLKSPIKPFAKQMFIHAVNENEGF